MIYQVGVINKTGKFQVQLIELDNNDEPSGDEQLFDVFESGNVSLQPDKKGRLTLYVRSDKKKGTEGKAGDDVS